MKERVRLCLRYQKLKLSYKQKLILEVLQDEFHGEAFGPQMLKETENEDLKQLTINEIHLAYATP